MNSINPPPIEKEFVFVPVPDSNTNYPKGLRFLKEAYDRIRNIRLHFRIFLQGWKVFQKTGITSRESHTSLINLFCLTRGVSNSLLHFFTKRPGPKYRFQSVKGFLADSPKDIQRALKAIRKDGFYIFPQTLSPEIVDKIYDRMLKTKSRTDLLEEPLFYDANQKKGTRYAYNNETTLAFPEIQELIADPSLLCLGQEYLGCQPVLDLVNVTITTDFLKYPSELSAQYYHFDMDRIRWLKIFVYLTDVTSDTGPTCFIKGSHKPFGIPQNILHHRYSRLPEELVEKHYSKDKMIEVTGKKGTIVALDTRGLHKGKRLNKGDRFIMQFEFTGNLFGAPIFYSTVESHSPALNSAKEKYPAFYEIMKIK